MVRNSCRASAKPSPVGNSALICALIWSAVQPAAVGTFADGGCVGSGGRSFVHAVTSSPPAATTLLSNGPRLAITSAWGPPGRDKGSPAQHQPARFRGAPPGGRGGP